MSEMFATAEGVRNARKQAYLQKVDEAFVIERGSKPSISEAKILAREFDCFFSECESTVRAGLDANGLNNFKVKSVTSEYLNSIALAMSNADGLVSGEDEANLHFFIFS